MKLGVALASVLGLASFATTSHAEVPSYVQIRNISYAGTGCPAGTVAQNVSPDLQAFTLLFDSYVAEVGPGIALSESRKNCQILIDLNFPAGWSYTVATVDYRGYASLEANVTGQQQSSYYFQGQFQTGRLSTTINGPITRDYTIRDTIGLSTAIWSPCGAQRALNINSQVRLQARFQGARGLLTTDSIDGSFKMIYGLVWRRC